MIREVKFNKKIDAMRKRGMSWDLKVSFINALFLLVEIIFPSFKL